MKSLNFLALILVTLLFISCTDKTKKNKGEIITDSTKLREGEVEVDNSIGVISLSDGYSKQDSIKIYNEDGSLWYKFTYYYDDNDGVFEYHNPNFSPLAFHPDYFLLALKVSGIQKNRYEVIVNENTHLKKFINKESFLKFEHWKDHILNIYAVDFNSGQNPLRKEPNNQAPQISYKSDNFYQPKRIDGNWLQVTWKENQITYLGWIKWKEDGSLLIDLLYLN